MLVEYLHSIRTMKGAGGSQKQKLCERTSRNVSKSFMRENVNRIDGHSVAKNNPALRKVLW